jgi:hypothetical protein
MSHGPPARGPSGTIRLSLARAVGVIGSGGIKAAAMAARRILTVLLTCTGRFLLIAPAGGEFLEMAGHGGAQFAGNAAAAEAISSALWAKPVHIARKRLGGLRGGEQGRFLRHQAPLPSSSSSLSAGR